MAVGIPRCSWSRIRSVIAEALALETRLGRIKVPRFNLIDVGINSLISLAKADNLVEGDLEVVMMGLGSVIPERWAYSSSISWCSSAVSSYL